MTKFFNKFKKPCFMPILGPFSSFLGQIFFPEISSSVTYNFYGFLKPSKHLEKTNDTIPKKCLERRKDGRADAIS